MRCFVEPLLGPDGRSREHQIPVNQTLSCGFSIFQLSCCFTNVVLKKPKGFSHSSTKETLRFTSRNQRTNFSHRKHVNHTQITHACRRESRRSFYHAKNNLLGEKEMHEMTCCLQQPQTHSHQLTGRTLRSKVIAQLFTLLCLEPVWMRTIITT